MVTEPVHVQRWGTYVTTPDITAERAVVRVRTTVVNESGAAAEIQVVSRIVDPDGRTAARTSTRVAVADRADETHELTVAKPRLWDFATPDHRYTLETELRVGDARVDTCRTPFGIRTFRFDPDEGFHLNGVHAKIGGRRHHDQGAGAPRSAWTPTRQMAIMKSMGVNAFRTSHNPPSPQMIQVCEELGIVMMVEAFDCWRTGKTRYDYGRLMSGASRTPPRWSSRPATRPPWCCGPSATRSPTPPPPRASRWRTGSSPRSRRRTTPRPLVIGSATSSRVPTKGSAADLMLAKLDGLGLNYNTAQSVDALHAAYPHLFLFESESSSETSTRSTYQEPQHLNTGETHTRLARGLLVRQQPRVLDDERRVRQKKDRDRKWFAGTFCGRASTTSGSPRRTTCSR